MQSVNSFGWLIISLGGNIIVNKYMQSVNPLLHTGHYCVRMTKILILK